MIWATHLQADILAVAACLDRSPEFDILIVAPDAAAFMRSPFAAAVPFSAPVLDRHDPRTKDRVRDFGADLVIADNHVPPPGCAPRLLYMWHGMGWKARARLDLEVFYLQVRQLTGADPRRENGNFLAQCYGPTDRDWRIKSWDLPAQSCVELGMAFSDLLLNPPYSREELAKHYKIDILKRKTVLLSVTWHHGGIFGSEPTRKRSLFELLSRPKANQDDIRFLSRLVEEVRRKGANLLICLHDRHRFDPALIEIVESFAKEDFVEVHFKNEHPDNLADLLVADVMMSNLSSFVTYFYVLGRPAIHLHPQSIGAEKVGRVRILFSRVRLKTHIANSDAWMLDPNDTGGPIARTASQALAALSAAFGDPHLGKAQQRAWLARHVPVIDGLACERFKYQLLKFARPAIADRPTVRHPEPRTAGSFGDIAARLAANLSGRTKGFAPSHAHASAGRSVDPVEINK